MTQLRRYKRCLPLADRERSSDVDRFLTGENARNGNIS